MYVTREQARARQLLVFTQDSPEAGIQLPGDGIVAHETPHFWMTAPTRDQLIWDGDYLDLVFPAPV